MARSDGPADWQARAARARSCSAWLPALFVLVAITVAPAIYLVVTSLTPLNLINPASGLDFSDPALNYREAFADRASSTRSGSRSSSRSRR